MEETDQKEVQQMISESLKLAMDFSTRKLGDTPTDDLQLTPKKYVDENITTLAVSGQASIKGNVVLAAGTNITLTESGQIITIAAGNYGGTGADGALSVTSGATSIDLGSATVFIKNYTSISITGSGAIQFINPASAGTAIVLRSQGNVTLTSSAAPMIDASGCGAAGGTGGVVSSNAGSVTDGTTGTTASAGFVVDGASHGGGGGGKSGSAGGTGTAGSAGPILTVTGFYTRNTVALVRRSINLFCGNGGGGGGGAQGSQGAACPGGNGGGALYIECGGALNFTTSSGISVNGVVGTSATGTTENQIAPAGGGGGGSAGMCVILYTTLTSASGTVTSLGGNGGNGTVSSNGDFNTGGGGGGAGGISGAGGAGGAGVGNNTNGNNGANGSGGGGGGGGSSAQKTGGTAGIGGTGSIDTGGSLVAQNFFIV